MLERREVGQQGEGSNTGVQNPISTRTWAVRGSFFSEIIHLHMLVGAIRASLSVLENSRNPSWTWGLLGGGERGRGGWITGGESVRRRLGGRLLEIGA